MKKNYFLTVLLFITGLFCSLSATAQIVANNDSGTVVSGSPATVVISNVLGNDTFNGLPVTLSQATISSVSSTNNHFTINANGALTFSGGAISPGVYTVEYQLCQIGSTSNCDWATAFVSVTQNTSMPLHATDDYVSITTDTAAGTIFPDILANDTLNGLPVTLSQVSITETSSTTNYFTIEANGSVTYSNAPAPPGTYSVGYTICQSVPPFSCSIANVNISVGCTVPPPVIGTIVQPSCISPNGSITINGVPPGSMLLYSYNGIPYQSMPGTGGPIVIPVTGNNQSSSYYDFYIVQGQCTSPHVNATVNPTGGIGFQMTGTYVDYNADGLTDLGDVIEYHYTVTNYNCVLLTNIEVLNASLNITGGPLASLAPGAADSTTFTALYPLTQSDINAGYVVNSSYVTGSVGSLMTEDAIVTVPLDLNDGIKLVAFIDTNNNGVKDGVETNFTLGDFNYEIDNDGIVHHVAANLPLYLFETNTAASYDLSFTVNSAVAAYYTVTPSSYSNITVAANSGITTYYFPVSVVPFTDAAVYLYAGAPPRPGFQHNIMIAYTNQGNQVISSGTLTFNKASQLTITNISQTGTVPTANGFTFTYTNLAPGETRYIYVTVLTPVIPNIALGDQLASSVTASIPSGDINIANNAAALIQTVVGSYDPNEKEEAHEGQVLFSGFTANDYLTYTIRFENTGTASAINIRVNDVLDSKLDETSVRTIAASHAYRLDRVGNTLNWFFDGIDLPPSVDGDQTTGHGFVTFQVKPKAGFALGDVIPNVGNIYFDFNPAIVTNECSTQFVSVLSTKGFAVNNLKYYPNPVSNKLYIENDTAIQTATVTSVLGQKVLEQSIGSVSAQIDLSGLPAGVYMVTLKTASQSETIKVIKN